TSPPALHGLSLHDALPICGPDLCGLGRRYRRPRRRLLRRRPGRHGGHGEAVNGADVVLMTAQGSTVTAVTKPTTVVTKTVAGTRSEEHTSELQSRGHLVCR